MAKQYKPIATIHIKNGVNLVETYDNGEKLFNDLWYYHKHNQRDIQVTFGHKLYNWTTNANTKQMFLICDKDDITHFDKFDKLTAKVEFDILTGVIRLRVTNLIKCA